MVERIPDLPGNVVGFTAKGTVTAEDYETVIMPAVDAQSSSPGKIQFLYHLGEEFTGFDAGAVWDDAKVGLLHFAGWERIAVVTDTAWVRGSVRLLSRSLTPARRAARRRGGA